MDKDKILGMIGMAMKAGRLVSGEFMTEKSVKEGHAKLVIIAGDASDNTKKLFHNKCSFYNVPIFEYSDKETLGAALGKEIRTSVAITDDGFAKSLTDKLQNI